MVLKRAKLSWYGHALSQAEQAAAAEDAKRGSHVEVVRAPKHAKVHSPSEQSQASLQEKRLAQLETTDAHFAARQTLQSLSAAVGFLQTANGGLDAAVSDPQLVLVNAANPANATSARGISLIMRQ
jgi:hypothetical protein